MTSYRLSGVDQEAADALVPALARHAARTRRGRDMFDVGGFAGIHPLSHDISGLRQPALALSTDGVGTKIELLRAAGRHRTAGWDCVAMNVDDVVCSGAVPTVFVDYIAIERLVPEVVEEIVGGVADACIEAGCELVGGETAQHPGTMLPGSYDVSGTCVGVVDLQGMWGPQRVGAGDQIVGLASSGLHANGYALVRTLLGEGEPPGALLEPTAIYAGRLLEAAAHVPVHAAAHVTGGGIPGNLPRALPAGAGARIDGSAWPRPEVYAWLAERGVGHDEQLRTFNCGLGMLLLTPAGEDCVEALGEQGIRAWVVGEVHRSGVVEIV